MFSTKWFWALGLTLGAAIVALAALPLAPLQAGRVQAHQLDRLSPNASIFARGLIAPRGLKFGPDGFLYVAVPSHELLSGRDCGVFLQWISGRRRLRRRGRDRNGPLGRGTRIECAEHAHGPVR
jgi:hypothetical protein